SGGRAARNRRQERQKTLRPGECYGRSWEPSGLLTIRESAPGRIVGTDAIDLMLECQGNYCNHAFSLTFQSAKRDNQPIARPLFRARMNRHNLRRTLCVILVAFLLAPSFGLAQPQPAPSPSPAPSISGRSVTTPFGSGARTAMPV